MKFIINFLFLFLKLTCIAGSISGITYSPYSLNGCLSKSEIQSQLLSLNQFTNKIRLFGADCNQVDTILSIIESNNLNLRVTLGIWTRSGVTRFNSDLQAVITALKNPNYLSLCDNVVVGNEELYNGGKEVDIISNLNQVREQLQQNQIQLKVGYCEVFNLWSQNLINQSDIIMPTIYPFYTQNNGDSLSNVAQLAAQQMEQLVTKFNTNKPIIIGETGYPNAGSAPTMLTPPSPSDQCTYLSNFKSSANQLNLPFFFMEAYDSNWKQGYSSDQHFGIINSSNNQLLCPSLI